MKSYTSKLLALAALGLASFGFTARAALPLANTPIGNQAKATYTDDSGVVREVFSNTVVTRVTQVYALDLTQDNSRLATPGSQVYFAHTVTNNGNGQDIINLVRTPGGAFSLLPLAIYPDTNRDGLPDSFTAITATPSLAPGEQYSFVIAGIVAASATVGQTATVSVVATSAGDVAATDTNTDTVTITNNAVMQVTKAIDRPSGPPGTTPIKYTITYTNTGNSSATNFTITDTIPTNMTYIAGSARWSVIPSTTLTDTNAADNQSGIIYDFNVTTANEATFVIASVAPGQSGFVTFTVGVDAGTAPGIIPNTAVYAFTSGGAQGPFNTNTVPFLVTQVAGVTLTPPAPVANAEAGDTVPFTNVLVNTGTGTDTFDITITGNNYPSGTTFQLFQSDGNTPLTDSNGNGTPDTGPVVAGGTYNIILKAILPGNATAGGPYTVTKLATSTFNPTVTDDADDVLTTILGASVDLTNNVALPAVGLGAGAQSGNANATVIVNNSTNPGTTTTFTLVVNNTGPNPDTYNLLADDDGTFGTVNDLPAGWTIVFKNAAGTVVTNTGTIANGANATFTAEIFVPAGTTPGVRDIYFRSLSLVTNAGDSIRDSVTVNTVRSISIQSDNVGQTFPGGSIVYEHIITNNGNINEGSSGGANVNASAIAFSLANNLSAIGFNAILYYDAPASGTPGSLDSADSVITGGLSAVQNAGIAPGAQVRLFVKVFAPLGSPDSAVNVTTVTLTTSGGAIDGVAAPAPQVNTDTTTVIRGDLSIVKEQAIDLNADGSIGGGEGPFVTTQLSAPPGAVIIYRITVTNTGSADATTIVVNDTVPSNTTYYKVGAQGDATIVGGTTATIGAQPANGATGNFVFNVGTLAPLETSVITFGAQIDD